MASDTRRRSKSIISYDMVEVLISFVQERPNLWDDRHVDFKDTRKSRKQWEEIASQLDISRDEAKKKWKNMKDTYRRVHRNLAKVKSSSSAAPRIPWRFYEPLHFLQDVFDSNSTFGNLPLDGENNSLSDSDDNAESTLDKTSVLPSTSSDREDGSILSKRNSARRKRSTKSVVDENILTLKQQKFDVTISMQHQEEEKNDNYLFLMSILPYMDKLCDLEKLELRTEMMELVMKYYKQTLASQHNEEDTHEEDTHEENTHEDYFPMDFGGTIYEPTSSQDPLSTMYDFDFDEQVLSRRPRRFGVHPMLRERARYGEYHRLFSELKKDGALFFEYIRMSIETFDFIATKLNDHIEKKRVGLKSQVSPEERLVVTIRFLATGASFRLLAQSFCLGRSTVSQIIYDTCKKLWINFVDDFMPQPTEDHLKSVADQFYGVCGFPNCFGAIDYLHHSSTVSLVVADAHKKFLVIEVGAGGTQSDGGTFSLSKLYRKLESNSFNVPPETILPGTSIQVPHVLVADEAFPLKTYMMRPYSKSKTQLDQPKELFNDRLSRAKNCVEYATGILRTKWRFLLKEIELPNERKVSILVRAACILHNIIREKDGDNDPDSQNSETSRDNVKSEQSIPNEFRNPSSNAKDVRMKFKQFFQQA